MARINPVNSLNTKPKDMIFRPSFAACQGAAFTLALAILSGGLVHAAKEKKGAGKGSRSEVPMVLQTPEEPSDNITPKISVKATAAKIDELVEKKLAEQKLQPNEVVSDEIFLRRIYLDVIGRVPTKAEALKFLQSTDPAKRTKLINELLRSDGYVQNAFNFWADLLRVKTTLTNQGAPVGHAYIQWIKDSVRANKHYDLMVRELLTATGPSYENGAVGYYMRDYNMPLDNMAVTTQIFLGTQMVCAQCHNHPFDKWTQKDYYEIAAHSFGMAASNVFTNQNDISKMLNQMVAETKERTDIRKAFTEILFQLRFNHIYAYNRSLQLPHDYKYPDGKPNQRVAPVIPASFSKDGKIVKEGEQPIVAYARWLTSPENPRFTTVIANRIWKKLMGIGVIDPVDEITDSTVPSNAPLMEFLEQTMKDVNYDLKAYMRVVLNSKTYQRAASTKDVEPGAPYYFAGPLLRRMTAEQIWDSMVALAKDKPDEASHALHLETAQLLNKVEWMDRTLNNQTPEELIEGAKQIAAYQKELSEKIKAGGDATVNAKNQRKKIFEKVDEVVYNNGFKKFAEEVSTGTRKLADETDAEFASQVADAVRHYKRIPTMDEALEYVNQEQRQAYQAWLDVCKNEEIKARNITKPDQLKAFSAFSTYRERYLVRSADLRNPAPNGHFLRSFGQSDRELVDNGNRDASVMQSLTMMNGNLFRNLVSPFSVISREMRQDKTASEIIDTIYLSTLSRTATAEEKDALLPLLKGNINDGRGDVLWTVLNTRQFLFIQ